MTKATKTASSTPTPRTPASESSRLAPAVEAAEVAAGHAPDIDEAARAFAKLGPALAALDERTLVHVALDPQQAALVALSLDTRLRHPQRASALVGLAGLGLARKEDIDGLGDAALATWYARHKLLEVAAVASKAALPAELRAEANACRTRMRSSLEYNVPESNTKGWDLLSH